MADLARQSILHAFVAALVYAALVRAWRVDDPDDRVALGLVALAVPVGWLPLLWLVAPVRNTLDFREERALFDSGRWNDLLVFGMGLADVVLAGVVLTGVALFLRDALPWLRERAARHPGPAAVGPAGNCPRVPAVIDALADRMRLPPPALVVLDDEAPVLLCAGWSTPSIVVSRGAYARLDDEELLGAVAHELAHIERRDTTLGWLLMAVRMLFWFNPVVQVLARDLVQEIERRADDRAAAVTGDRVALASSVLKIFTAGEGRTRSAADWPVPGLDTPARVVDRFTAAVVEARCRRLLDDPVAATPPALSRLRVALAGAGMMSVLFFVV
jgi:Zn-dependent protease with chaperone function